MEKIIVTDNIIAKSLETGLTVDEVLAKEYEGVIEDKVKNNEAYKKLSPLKMAMADYGLSGKSLFKDFNTSGAGEWLLPAFIDTRLREAVGRSSILSYLVGNSIGVDGIAVTSASLDLTTGANAEAIQTKRVAEGADIPTATIKLGESALRLFKRGRAVEATYEALQYMRVDLFTKAIEAIGSDVAGQQVGDALQVLANGDGNSNKPNYVPTATANVITDEDIVNMLLAWNDQTNNPIDTIVASPTFFKQLFKMSYSTTEASGSSMRMKFNTPQFNFDTVNVIVDRRVPKDNSKEQIIALNKSMALNKYVANGSNIRELQTNIRNQTKLGTISEIAAFAVFDKNSILRVVSK